MNFNKVIIAGRLTKEVETGFTNSGTAFAKCSIAVDSGYGDKKKVCFIDFVTWGKTSEFLSKHFTKGKAIIIEGELQLDTWEKDGKKNYKHSLNVSQVGFAGGDKTATTTENQPIVDEDEAF